MAKIKKRVSFLMTGEELIAGDSLETNGTDFSQYLTQHDIHPGQRLVVGDEVEEIKQAISYLLSHHEALVTVGGLGPTLDDRTRDALSAALNRKLVFNDRAWQWIVERLNKKGIAVSEADHQQAWLPIDSTPIYNANGTAAACYFQHKGKDIFMLPGPPRECLPIFRTTVLPILLENDYAYKIFRKSWWLLKAHEGMLADQLQKLIDNTGCHLGYRLQSPYLEIKLWSEDKTKLEKLSQRLLPILKPYLIDKKPSLS